MEESRSERDSDHHGNNNNNDGTQRTQASGGQSTSSSTKQSPDTFYSTKEGPTWSKRSRLNQWMPFRGMFYDLRRRAPFYISDWTLAFERRNIYRVTASTLIMYFINIMPAIAYTLDMNTRTGGYYGINETILASALAALVFPLFSCQPLTIVGITGLISLVNYTQYNIVTRYGVDYLQFQAWTYIWSAITHWIVAVFNISDFVRFITDMTSETFGLYVGTIYIIKGVELLVHEFDESKQDGWFSCFLAVFFSFAVYYIQHIGGMPFLPFWTRKFVSEFALAAGIIFFTGFSQIPGNIKSVEPLRVPITKSFGTSVERDWVVPFWDLDGKWIAAAIPFGCLITLLFYFDHSVSSVMAQARHFPIKRPAGFHWDFFLLGCVVFVCGVIGLPAPNGLVPQAPVNTESLSIMKQVPESKVELYTNDSKNQNQDQNQDQDQSEEDDYVTIRTRVVEQRVNHFAMGLLCLGTMARPLLVVLSLMSRAMFAGVFFVVGWGSIEGNGILHKFLFLLRDPKLTPKNHPLLQVKKRKIMLFIGIQLLVYGISIAISQTIAAIGFPIIVTLLIPWRTIYGPKTFTADELSILDAPTADSYAVLVSCGGELERVTGEGLSYAPDTGFRGTLQPGDDEKLKKSKKAEPNDEEVGKYNNDNEKQGNSNEQQEDKNEKTD